MPFSLFNGDFSTIVFFMIWASHVPLKSGLYQYVPETQSSGSFCYVLAGREAVYKTQIIDSCIF